MTTHIVADDTLGTISRRMWEVQRRLMEGTLEPSFVARNLQSIVESKDVSTTPLVTANPFFADEEVESDYCYPQEYAVVKSIYEQLLRLTRFFPNLDPLPILKPSTRLPDFSSFIPAIWMGREILPWVNWFVVPQWEKVASSYNEAVEKVLDLIGNTRTFCNYREDKLGPEYLQLSEQTAAALRMLGENHLASGDFLLIPAQFGFVHRGRSVRRARVVYAPHEFGLGSFSVGCMLLSHPERLVKWEQLYIDCPGDEYSSDADGRFNHTPLFYFDGGEVKFSVNWVNDAYDFYGSASGFVLPQ